MREWFNVIPRRQLRHYIEKLQREGMNDQQIVEKVYTWLTDTEAMALVKTLIKEVRK